jgi:hypothetical protein
MWRWTVNSTLSILNLLISGLNTNHGGTQELPYRCTAPRRVLLVVTATLGLYTGRSAGNNAFMAWGCSEESSRVKGWGRAARKQARGPYWMPPGSTAPPRGEINAEGSYCTPGRWQWFDEVSTSNLEVLFLDQLLLCHKLRKLHIDKCRTNRIKDRRLMAIARGWPDLQEQVLIG